MIAERELGEAVAGGGGLVIAIVAPAVDVSTRVDGAGVATAEGQNLEWVKIKLKLPSISAK